MIGEQRSPRYLKTFTYHEIRECANNNGLSFSLSLEKEPLTLHIANETFRELQSWHALLGIPFDSEKLQKQAALTGIYTAWSKAMLDTFKEEPKPLKKALNVGAIAARSKMRGEKYRNETDRLLDAEKHQNEIERHIQAQLAVKAPEIMHLNTIAQEELIRTAYRCHAVTGKVLPPDIMNRFINGLEHIPNDETRHRSMVAVINAVIDRHIKNKQPLIQTHVQHAIEQQKQHDTLMLKTVQLGKDKALHLEQQRALQQDRGFERGL